MTRRLLVPFVLLVLPAALRAAPPDFDRQIAPLLAAHCLDCHRGPKPKGDLDLSRKAAVLGDGKTTGAVVAGKPGESTLWERVAAGEMPPKKPLPEAEKKLLKEWIEGGAKWGTDPLDPFRFTTATRAGFDWWALQPVKRPAVPETRAAKPDGRNEIDRFVLAKLGEKGLTPSPPADRRTLIRRVTFDLTGLPPSPEEVAAFLTDDSPDAYGKVVDRLLASKHYGERWARHWLDVVRYGETDGFERNAPRPNAWPYRDWVIRSLNADLPYDEFVRLQLAGDVLRPGDPDAVKATGFLVAGVHNTVLGNDQMRAVARQDELEDLVGAVGQTFLGLTVNCARCHDHKFDPIAQTDYYRLAAALSGVGHGERTLQDAAVRADVARLTAELEAGAKELGAIEEPARRAALA
ncbi:MAG: Planctomycete cytochrome, partial [Gemmataceae bacterium]|nr:Planctomycete cytochrome [Gemmataceae bacterium]